MGKRMQDGGKVLGEGGFGCVISPPLKCKNHFLNVPYSIDDKYISKLVEYSDDDEMMNEIKISSKILKLDQNQKYFSPIINGCVFSQQKSNDIEYNRFKPFFSDNSDSDDSNNDNQDDMSNKKCNIYMNSDYLNLISKNAGINMYSVLKKKSPELISFLKKNYINIFKHLCNGLNIIHKNNILHRDIKLENMMIKYNNVRDTAKITYIDFGLTTELKKSYKLYKLSELYELTYSGTDGCKPLEIVILNNMFYYLKKNRYYDYDTLSKEVISKTYHEFKDYSDDYFENLYLVENGFKYVDNKLRKKMTSKKTVKYGNKNIIKNIFEYLYRNYKNDLLIQQLIDEPKYILKWDVFSLGLIFAEMIVDLDINNEKAFKFINKMIAPYYWDRYTISECLDDPIFNKKKTLKFLKTKTLKSKTLKEKTLKKSKK
jgi:serine/threonine protein kinase